MKVFQISPDFAFQTFYTLDPDVRGFSEVSYLLELTQCSRMLQNWKPLRLAEESSKLKRGNFAHSWGGGFIIDTRAIEALRPILEQSCELLPLLPHKGESLQVMNVLDCVDCLDEEKTRRAIDSASGMKLTIIEEFHFDSSSIRGSSLFKLPKRPEFFTVTGLVDPQIEFRSVVEREALTGIKFEELWSD